MLMSSVIGHRGARALVAENTLASIRRVAELGGRWVELDVQLSRDGVPFLFHDDQLAPLTGQTGRVGDYDAHQLEQMQVIHGAQPAQPLASLAQALNLCIELGLGLNLELKSDGVQQGAKTLEVCWPMMRDRPELALVISSFDPEALVLARRLCPAVPRSCLFEALPKNWRDQVDQVAARAVHLDAESLQAEQVAQIKQLGLEVYCYTVNSLERGLELRKWGVQGIFTDAPQLFLDAPEWRSLRLQAFGG